MVINKDTLQQFREDLKSAVANLEKYYGVTITPGTAKYSDVEFSLTIKVANTNAEEVKLQKTFNEQPWFRDWYNKQFIDGRHTFTVIGYEPYKKYDIICKRDDGEIYNYTYTFVSQHLQFV